LHQKLYEGNIKLFAEASEIFTHAVLQLVIIHKTTSSERIFEGAKKVEVGGCKMGFIGRMREKRVKSHVSESNYGTVEESC
jgi:hypothetical protein